MADNENQNKSVGSTGETTTTTKPADPDPILEENPELKKHEQKQQKERGQQ